MSLNNYAQELISLALHSHNLPVTQCGSIFAVGEQLRLSIRVYENENGTTQLFVYFSSAWTGWRTRHISYACFSDETPEAAIDKAFARFLSAQFHVLIDAFCAEMADTSDHYSNVNGRAAFFGCLGLYGNATGLHEPWTSAFTSYVEDLKKDASTFSPDQTYCIAHTLIMLENTIRCVEAKQCEEHIEPCTALLKARHWQTSDEGFLFLKQLTIFRAQLLPKKDARARLLQAIWAACSVPLTKESLQIALAAEGFLHSEVRILEVLLPMAFAKRICESFGAEDYDASVAVRGRTGASLSFNLREVPLYQLADALAQDCFEANADLDYKHHVLSLASMSAQYDCLCKVLDGGGTLHGSRSSVLIFGYTPEEFGIVEPTNVRPDAIDVVAPSAKPWWRRLFS